MTTPTLRPTCMCTAPIMLRDGRVVCAQCGAPITAVVDALPDVYSSHGPLPPGWSRRRYLERVRKHPKARRIGGKRGRGVHWEIDRADFEATKAAPRKPTQAPVVSIDEYIRDAGYRMTRSA